MWEAINNFFLVAVDDKVWGVSAYGIDHSRWRSSYQQTWVPSGTSSSIGAEMDVQE